jgi:dipeptidase E
VSAPRRGRRAGSHDRRRIFAMGGGGFAGTPGDPALDEYVLDVARAPRPHICLLPTASGDPEEQIRRFYSAYRDLPCEPTHLSLFRLGTRPVDLRELILAQDVVYVGGGSMLNLLAIWSAHGLDAVLREAWERGIVLCGISAGSMCWFEAGVSKSFGPPRPVRGLGFLRGSNSVHHHSERERAPVLRRAIAAGDVPPGYAVDDGAGLLFAGTRLTHPVAARPGAGAWWVDRVGGEVTERPLELTLLPPREDAGDTATPLSIAEFRALRRGRGSPNRLGSYSAERETPW